MALQSETTLDSSQRKIEWKANPIQNTTAWQEKKKIKDGHHNSNQRSSLKKAERNPASLYYGYSYLGCSHTYSFNGIYSWIYKYKI